MARERRTGDEFDQVAELYDRARLGYPAELYDRIVAFASLPSPARVLEIGAGTGQATRFFAERGDRVVCLEPGAALALIARSNLRTFQKVEIVEQRFEEWEASGTFDLVIAAQSFHWVDPAIRVARVSSVLDAHGRVALFWNLPAHLETSLRRALDHAYRVNAPGMKQVAGQGRLDERVDEIHGEMRRAATLTDVQRHEIMWRKSYSRDSYVTLLRTHRAHIVMEPVRREAVLAAVRNAIDRHGGQIEVEYRTVLLLGRRAEGS